MSLPQKVLESLNDKYADLVSESLVELIFKTADLLSQNDYEKLKSESDTETRGNVNKKFHGYFFCIFFSKYFSTSCYQSFPQKMT